jgi:hypothetical protein
MSHSQWLRAATECEYEATKATAAVKGSIIASEKRDEIYVLCLETKGVQYVGKRRVNPSLN